MARKRAVVKIWPAMAGCALLWTGLVTSASLTAQSPADGKALFGRRCAGCHALDRDKEGPRLGGVYGRVSGSVGSFQYSDALKQAAVKWDSESLDRWLTDPEKLVPNNDMTFHVESAAERAAIIAYLKQNSGQ